MQQSTYVDTFLQNFPQEQYGEVLNTILLLGIQYTQPTLSTSTPVTMASLRSLLNINENLSYAQNSYIPQAKKAMAEFKEKMSALELQLEQASFAETPTQQQLTLKELPAAGVETEQAVILKPVNSKLLNANMQVDKRLTQAASYPNWWGQEESPSLRRTSPKKSLNNSRRSSDPWKFPRKMVDECIQTNDQVLRQLDLDEQKDIRMRRIARRQEAPFRGPSDLGQYNEGLVQEEDQDRQENNHPSPVFDEDEFKVPVRKRHTPLKNNSAANTSVVRDSSYTAPVRAKPSVFLSFSPPRAKHHSMKPKRSTVVMESIEKEFNEAPYSSPSVRVNKHSPLEPTQIRIDDHDDRSDFIKIARDFVNSDFVDCLEL